MHILGSGHLTTSKQPTTKRLTFTFHIWPPYSHLIFEPSLSILHLPGSSQSLAYLSFTPNFKVFHFLSSSISHNELLLSMIPFCRDDETSAEI